MAGQRVRESVVGGYPGRMLLVLSVGWAVLQTGRFLLSPLLPAIIADLGITEATAGLALTLFQGVYAVTQYPSGEYSDRWSRSVLLVPGIVVLAAGFLAVGAGAGYAAFVAAVVVVGVGKGLFATPARAFLSDLFVDRRGRALGLFSAGTDVGGLLASGLAVLALGYASWRAPFVLVAALLALVGVAYAAWSREGYAVGGGVSLGIRRTVARVAADPDRRRALAAFGLFYFVVGGFVNFFPTYLARARGFPPDLASATFALVFVVGLAVKPLAGGLSDRFPRRTVAAAGQAVAATALAALVVVPGRLAVWGCLAVLAVGYKTLFPLADATVADLAPDGDTGADLGAARTLFIGIGALGPTYVGWVATYADYTVAFGGLAACLLASAALLVRSA